MRPYCLGIEQTGIPAIRPELESAKAYNAGPTFNVAGPPSSQAQLPPSGPLLTPAPPAIIFPTPKRRSHRKWHLEAGMELREFFNKDAVNLNLKGETKDEILKELIGLLGLDEKSEGILFKMLKRRENLGSTGIGRGIAIPHCRSLVVNRLRVAFGRKADGADFGAIDQQPVYNFFLIVAPPLEVSNQYLPVLGKIAQFAKEPDVPDRLEELQTPDDFLSLIEEKSSR
jgi:mannitol/fructose-specific phosphotransferase system IIA component (Ntr-type)